MNRLLSISIITVMLSALVSPALADDFVPAYQAENATNQFILDVYNTGGNVTLQFGTTLAEYLQWNDSTTEFELSDDLNLLNHQLKQFRVENLASNPGTCDASVEGKLYFNTSSDVLTVCANSSWTSVSGGGGGGSIDRKNIVYVDTQRATEAGEVYATLATAITYINTQSPGTGNPWAIIMQPGTNTETVTIPVSTILVGNGSTKNLFTGVITLDTGAAVQDVRVGSGGKLYVASGKTGYAQGSDVVLGDAGGGLDGTLSATNSYIDGIVAASGVLLAYQSYLGVSSISSTGTVSTYNSSAFNFTNSGTWNNFGVAYRNTVLASGSRLTSSNTQGAIDELVVGTPTPTFTFNVDEAGNPDQNVDIVAEQGTEANGTLRYDDGNNRWEMSNHGGSFASILSGANYLFGYDTNDQAVSSAGTFQTITFDNPTSVANGWTYSAGDFTTPAAGLYEVTYTAHAGRTNNGDTTVTVRTTKNGTEIAGSAAFGSPARDDRPVSLNNTFVVSLAAGDLLQFQLTSANTGNGIGLYVINAFGTTAPRIAVSINKIQ